MMPTPLPPPVLILGAVLLAAGTVSLVFYAARGCWRLARRRRS